MKILLTSILLHLTIFQVFAQEYSLKGTVTDDLNVPVDAVTCILKNKKDSTSMQTVITDSLGRYKYNSIVKGNYTIQIQHIAFESQILDISINKDTEMPPVIMQMSSLILSDVVVKGERPVVKAENGKLVYDAPLLIKDKVVSNAFDVIKNIPNVTGSDDDISLVGTDNFTILLDGQKTSMTLDQLKQVLKSMPASKVKDIEIMYSAPPQYNVRGAAINVVFNDATIDTPKLQGEANLNYYQNFYAGYKGGGNIVYTQPSYSIDFTLGATSGKGRSESKMYAKHQLNGHVYDIHQDNTIVSDYYGFNTRLAFNYSLKNKDRLQFIYTGEYNDAETTPSSKSIYTEDNNAFANINSKNNVTGDTWLHNMKAEYNSHKKLNIGVDYTWYKDPTTQKNKDYENGNTINSYKTQTTQKIDKTTFFANHSASLGKAWEMTYGGNFSYSKNNNSYSYFDAIQSSVADSLSHTFQEEYSGSVYTSFTKSFTKKLSMQMSLSANYFKATVDVKEHGKKDLWNDFQPFINANLTYLLSEKNTLQFSFSSDITYPPYWALSPDVTALNAYSEVRGNPELKYSRSYESQLTYIFNRKYVLVGFYKYQPDLFQQMPYQSDSELKNVFQMENIDNRQALGLAFIVPFVIDNLLNSKATLSYQHTTDKDSDFLNTPFKKSKNSFVFNMSNTVNISSKPNIKMDVSAFYMNGHVQGVYDIHHMTNINAGLKYTFLNNNAELMGQVQDIFKTGGPSTSINILNQYSTMDIKILSPTFKVSFIYKFGNYKKKQTDTIDTSRFGRG